ncbi:MAG: rhomboid family intramembrane serine protease [Syntrophomonadaceae bacterium]|nr:rhomboid family intramembrane serine protease [Syntrophomonadaceae bacterium]
MIPLRDSTPSRSFPIVTVLIIMLNLYIFYQEILMGPYLDLFISYYGMIPADFRPFNLLSSIFLHGGWMHVIGNMWVLWLFGDNVEDHMGHFKFLIFYLLMGGIAGTTHYLMNPVSTSPVVGASGAVAGVMGAYFLMFRQARVFTYIPPIFLVTIPAWVYLGFWALSQLYGGAGSLAGATSNIAFWAHIGGFIGGMILYKLFLDRNYEESYE